LLYLQNQESIIINGCQESSSQQPGTTLNYQNINASVLTQCLLCEIEPTSKSESPPLSNTKMNGNDNGDTTCSNAQFNSAETSPRTITDQVNNKHTNNLG